MKAAEVDEFIKLRLRPFTGCSWLAVALLCAVSTKAADYYWDANGTEAGFGSASGTWGESAYWSTDPTGVAEPSAVTTTTDDTLYFGTEDSQIGSGTISVSGDVEAGNIVVFAGEGETLTFSGSGTLTLAADGRICECCGGQSNVFDVAVASPGNCTFALRMNGYEFYPTDGGQVINASSNVVVLYDVALEDVVPNEGYFKKRGWAGLNAVGAGTICFIDRDDDGLTFQCQVYDGWTKCAKIRLTQSGDDVVARLVYTRYYSVQYVNLVGTFDFDSSSGWSTFSPLPVWNATKNCFGGGYGVDYLNFKLVQEPVAVLCKSADISGVVTNSPGCVLRLEHADALCDDGALSSSIHTDGRLVFGGTARMFDIAQQISGSGSVQTDFSWPTGQSDTVESILSQTEWTKIADSGPLLAVTNGTAIFTGASVNNKTTVRLYCPKFDNSSKIVTLQAQHYDGGYTKCVYIEVKDESGALYVRTPSTEYVTGDVRGTDFDTLSGGTDQSIATSETSNGYCLKNVQLEYGKGVGYVCISAKMPGGVTEICNSICDLAAPSSSCSWEKGCFGDGATFRAHDSTVNVTTWSPFGRENGTKVELDGSTINLSQETYLNTLILSNGSHVAGSVQFRAGYKENGYFYIRGSGASTIDSKLYVFSYNSSERTVTIDVADTTADESVDLNFNSVVTADSSFPNVYMVKTGEGTMRMSAANNLTYKPFCISEGVVRVGASSVFSASSKVSLDGGTLEVEGDVAASVGEFTLLANSTISLEDGATLAFADASSLEWTDGAILTVSGDLKKSTLTFGSSSSALTSAQQSALYHEDGRRLMLNENGRVVAVASGLVIICK